MKGLKSFEKDESRSQRVHSMDLLRIVSCMAVILAHSALFYVELKMALKGSVNWAFCFGTYLVFKCFIPIFAMLSGFFFLNPQKDLPLGKLYGKNILRLVLVLAFWTLFYAAILRGHYPFYPLLGQNTNYWYISMCIGLYMSLPVLRSIAINDKLLAYSCWIWLALRVYFHVGKHFAMPIEITDYVFTKYVGYCLWGYYLSRMKLSRRQNRMIYVLGLLFLAASTVLPLVAKGEVRYCLDEPAEVFASIAIFLFVIKHPIRPSYKMGKVIEHVSSMTLGIYMVHTFVLVELFTRIHRFFPNVFVLMPLSLGVTFVSSYIIVLIIKQIPIFKNWVV